MFVVFRAGVQAKTEVLDNQDGTQTVTYVPLSSGMYTLLLRYGGRPVPGFPAKVMVDPAVDTSGVRAFGPGLDGQGSSSRRTSGPLVGSLPDVSLSPPTQPFSEKPPQISLWTLVPSPKTEARM